MVSGCDDDDDGISSDECRLHPEHCNGGAGGLCDDDHDCQPDLFCCDDNNNCGDGMCTLSCDSDHDCPDDMLCEHDMCFYKCDSDEDCAPEMSCEHQNTICEYE
jgi:hypothetical protein